MSDDVAKRPKRASKRTAKQRITRAVVWVVGLSVYVWVMFTWVFPWAAENGLSPSVGS